MMNIGQADRPVRVALYARVSTRDKDQDPELQLDPMRAYAAARGWELAEYVDTAAAGDLAHRTEWARLLADAARRKIDRCSSRSSTAPSAPHCMRWPPCGT